MSSTSSINSSSSLMRLSGLSGSGIDVDSIVEKLMTAEKIPLNKLYQKRQLAQWKQDAYRDVTSKLKELKDTYFNSAKASSNLISTSSFKKYVGSSSDSAYVRISGNADAIEGSHQVSVVSLATAGKAVSGSEIMDAMTGNAITDFNFSDKKINVTLDGVTKEITLGDYSSNSSDIGNQIQTLMDDTFGTGKITVGYSDSKLTFNTTGGAGCITLSSGSSNDGLAALGFTSGASNRLDTSSSLDSLKTSFAKDLTFTNDELKFTINGKEFTFNKSVSLDSMMSTVSSDADANVNMKYDEITGKIVMTAKQLGAGNNIAITNSEGNFFGTVSDPGASGINTGNATTSAGTDGKAYIDGVLVTQNSNTINLDGTTYTLLKAHADPSKESTTVTLTPDVDSVYDNIKGFVDKYNELISNLNTKVGEKYDRDYQPLTDEQKKSMSDDDIKAWETKAKTGLLHNDSLLQDVVYNMRRALSDTVEVNGKEVSLSDIGITTGAYTDNGKLIIDETKLKNAIKNNSDVVSGLFTKKAENSYAECTTSELRSERYNSEGLANRLSDVFDDNIRTTNGKGLLLLKAGMEGDLTEYTSTLHDQISEYTDDIADLNEKLSDKETAYYAKFTAMETYISKMSSQSSWLSSQLSS